MRIDFLFGDADSQPDVPAADDRLVAVVGIHVEAHAGYTLGQRVARLVESVARRASYANRKLVPHVLPSCLFVGCFSSSVPQYFSENCAFQILQCFSRAKLEG